MKKNPSRKKDVPTPAPIPLFDLKRQYGAVAREMRAEVLRVLDSGRYILGPEVRAFESEFARAVGCRRAVGVSSGTAALRIALKALGVGPGDHVVLPAMTFVATATAVSELGAVPVLADVDPDSLTMGAPQAAAALTRRTKVLLPVHLYGAAADMAPLMRLARAKRLKVLEDCAQAHLASYKGRPAGSLGHAAAFSFYPTKNLGAAGDAGAVTTSDEALARAVLQLRNCGRSPTDPNLHEVVGYNSRMDELQAAVLRVKLRRLAVWTARRRKLAALYERGLAGLPLRLPDRGSGGSRNVFHLYPVRLKDRDALAAHLARRGIGSGAYYPRPLHLQPAYRGLGYRKGDFPHAEAASRSTLALPLFPELKEAEVERVCRAVREAFATCSGRG